MLRKWGDCFPKESLQFRPYLLDKELSTDKKIGPNSQSHIITYFLAIPDNDLLILGCHGLSGVVEFAAFAVKLTFSVDIGANGSACN